MLDLIQIAQSVATTDSAVALSQNVQNLNIMGALEIIGAFSAIAFAAIGCAFGTGIAGTAAVGCWKKCYLQNKPAPFTLLIFAGAPFSQVIYGMILMFMILGKWVPAPAHSQGLFMLLLGLLAGVAMGVCSYYQGVASAAAADAQADTGKGFALYLMVLGIVETISIFVMVFGIVLISKLG